MDEITQVALTSILAVFVLVEVVTGVVIGLCSYSKSTRPIKWKIRYFHSDYWRTVSIWRYLSIYLWLLYLVICEISQWYDNEPLDDGFRLVIRGISISFITLSYIAVLIESCSSRELKYLKNFCQNETAGEYIERQKLIPPKIYMTVECYHNESFTDDGGWEYEDRKVTFMETKELSYGSWVDVSQGDHLLECSKATATRFWIDHGFLFGDQEIFDDFNRSGSEMIERNRGRDDFTDFIMRVESPEMKQRLLGCVDSRMKPFWMRPLFFWIATLLQMTWPYRWVFKAKTNKIHYTLKKKVYKYAKPSSQEGQLQPTNANQMVVSGSWTVDSFSASAGASSVSTFSSTDTLVAILF